MITEERKQIILEAILRLRGQEQFNNLKRTIKETGTSLSKGVTAIRDQFNSFGRVMTMPFNMWQEFNKTGQQFTNTGARVANRIRMMTHGLRGFRMELLGVMFFGQMLAQTFGNMLRPAAEVFGLFDLWKTMLMVFFIPIMEVLAPILIKLMIWFIDAPPALKLVIGALVILGLVLGTLLFVVGAFGLGIGSIIVGLGFLGAMAPGALAAVTAAFAAIGVVIAAFLVILVGIWLAWKDNFGNIKAYTKDMFDGLKRMFSGVFEVLTNIFGVFIDFFKGDWEGVKEHFKGIIEGVKDIFYGFVEFALNLLAVLGLGIVRIISGAFTTMIDAVESLMVGLMNWLAGKIAWVAEKVASLLRLASHLPFADEFLGGYANKLDTLASTLKNSTFVNTPGLGFGIEQPNQNAIWPGARPNQSFANPSTVTYVTNYFSTSVEVSDSDKWTRDIEENNRKQMNELKKMMPTR